MEKRLDRIKGHAARIRQVTSEIDFQRSDPETAQELSLRLAGVIGVCEARSKMILDEMAPNAIDLAEIAVCSRAAAEAISALWWIHGSPEKTHALEQIIRRHFMNPRI